MVSGRKDVENNLAYVFAYILSWLSGILIYFTLGQSDKRLKFHAVQSIFYGVAVFVLGLILSTLFYFVPAFSTIVVLLFWLYGLYIGWEGSQGVDIEIMFVGKYARQYSK